MHFIHYLPICTVVSILNLLPYNESHKCCGRKAALSDCKQVTGQGKLSKKKGNLRAGCWWGVLVDKTRPGPYYVNARFLGQKLKLQ